MDYPHLIPLILDFLLAVKEAVSDRYYAEHVCSDSV